MTIRQSGEEKEIELAEKIKGLTPDNGYVD